MYFRMNKDNTESEEKCDSKDINEVFDDLFLLEDQYVKQGYQEGYNKGSTEDNIEAFHLGYHRGAELGAELGYYSAVIEVYLNKVKQGFECGPSDNVIKSIATLKEAIDSFPTSNIETEDILGSADKIRTLFKKLEKYIESLVAFLSEYMPLTNSHIVDFFTDSLFLKNIPSEFAQEISDNSKGAINNLFNIEFNDMYHLNRFIEKVKSFMLCNMQGICLDKQKFFNNLCINDSKYDSETCRFNGFMSSKKAHEVTVLNEIACFLYETGYVTHFIDIGDGKGYLSSLLALKNQIPVLGIDSSLTKTQGSVQRTNLLERNWNGFIKNKTKQKNSEKLPYKQVTHFVTEDTDFEKLVLDNLSCNTSKIGLLGLHTCGNLGASSIKIFVKNPKMSALCNVSCCYHFLTENDESTEYYFPLSKFLNEKNFKLGRNARMIASQSLERILHKVEEPKNTNFYRAILQIFLQKHNLNHFNFGRTKREYSSFEEYAKEALKKTDLNISDNELRDMYKQYEGQQNNFIAFYLLRCYLAPVIESLILLDRLLYLKENGIEKSYLVQLFDPIVSPRCHGLIALQKN